MPIPAHYPASVVAILNSLLDDLDRSLGATYSVCVYGSLARNQYQPDRSNVNLALIVDELSLPTLEAIRVPARDARQRGRVELFLTEQRELPRITDSFPLKLLQIQRHHDLIRGSEPFNGLVIPSSSVRLHLEQQLHSAAVLDDVVVLWVFYGAVFLVMRRIALGEQMPPVLHEMNTLGAYELGYLANGVSGVLQASVGALITSGALAVGARGLYARHAAECDYGQLSSIDAAVLRACTDATQKPSALLGNVEPLTGPMRSRLERMGMLVPLPTVTRVRLILNVLAVALLGLGAAKIMVGLARDRPVAILLLLVVACVFLWLACITSLPWTTRKGRDAVNQMRIGYGALLNPTGKVLPNEVAIAAGLYGLAYLNFVDTGLARLFSSHSAGQTASWGHFVGVRECAHTSASRAAIPCSTPRSSSCMSMRLPAWIA